MRGAEAEMVCPSIQLVQVPVARGKADLNGYRSAGSEVLNPLRLFQMRWLIKGDIDFYESLNSLFAN